MKKFTGITVITLLFALTLPVAAELQNVEVGGAIRIAATIMTTTILAT